MMDRLSTALRDGQSRRTLAAAGSLPIAPHAWCVEVKTAFPLGNYTFGPFDSRKVAGQYRSDYVEDLCRQSARGIVAQVKPYQRDDTTALLNIKTSPTQTQIGEQGLCPKKWF